MTETSNPILVETQVLPATGLVNPSSPLSDDDKAGGADDASSQLSEEPEIGELLETDQTTLVGLGISGDIIGVLSKATPIADEEDPDGEGDDGSDISSATSSTVPLPNQSDDDERDDDDLDADGENDIGSGSETGGPEDDAMNIDQDQEQTPRAQKQSVKPNSSHSQAASVGITPRVASLALTKLMTSGKNGVKGTGSGGGSEDGSESDLTEDDVDEDEGEVGRKTR